MGAVLAAEGHLVLRTQVFGKGHQAGLRAVGYEALRVVLAEHEAEALHVVGLGGAVVVEGREGLLRVELLDEQHVALVFVHQLEACGVEGSVAEYRQHLVGSVELAQVDAASLVVELLDVGVVPDILARDRGHAAALEVDVAYGVLGHQVAARRLALDGQRCEIVLEAGLLELGLGTQVDFHRLGFAVMVGREVLDAAARGSQGDVVLLVAGDARHREALGIVDAARAVAVDHVVDGALVAAVEHVHVEQVLAEEGLVFHLGYAVLAVAADHDYLAEVGAVADVLAAVVALETYSHEALFQVGGELGVVVHHLGGGDGLEAGELGETREVLAVLFLEALEPGYGVVGDSVDIVLHLGHFGFDAEYLLVVGLGVETGNLAHGLFHEPEDVVHHDLALEEVLIGEHLLEDVLQLVLPGLLVLFEHFVDAVLEEDLFQRAPVPVAFQFSEPDAQLRLQEVAGVHGVVFQDVVDAQELRLVVPDHAGVGGDVALAVRERVQGVDGLVGRHVTGQMDEDVHPVGGHVLDLLDLDLALVLGLEYGVDEHVGGLAIGNLRYGDRALVYLLDAGAHLHAASAAAVLVFAAVGEASGGEVRVDFVGLALEDLHGRVHQFVEVVGEYLAGHTHGDALRALCEQQRETHRELGRLLVAAVVGVHPVGDLRVEDHFLRELAQSCLDVSRCGVGVAGEDVAPVTLAVDEQAFLAQLHQGSQDGSVAVRMVLHCLSHDVGHLGVGAVVHAEHCVEHTPLHRFQAVHHVRHGPLQDHVRGVVEEPLLEHARQLEPGGVASQQAVEFTGRCGVFGQRGLKSIAVQLFFLGHYFVFFHNLNLRIRIFAVPCGFPSSRDPL